MNNQLLTIVDTVPVEVVPMTEVANTSELGNSLVKVFEDDLPGFVIRASGLVDIGAVGHEEITQAVIMGLKATDPLKRDYYIDMTKNFGRHSLEIIVPDIETPLGPGTLHNDAMGNRDGHFNVHTTDEGEGSVILANSSTSFDMSHYIKDRRQYDRLAHKQMLREEVDPRLIRPVIYTSKINTGDTVVFPFSKRGLDAPHSKRPVWHRFDTPNYRKSRTADVIVR